MSGNPRCVCATHSHCFDGLASAALFSEALSQRDGIKRFEYLPCGYGPGYSSPPRLNGALNALLDYRYVNETPLDFYFDHHGTAFKDDAAKRHFEAKRALNPEQFVWSPQAVSAASLIARHTQEHWGVDLENYSDLIQWADKIDGAQFKSAEEAIARTDGVMRLSAVVEKFSGKQFLNRALPILRNEGLVTLAGSPFIKEYYTQLAPLFEAYDAHVLRRGQVRGRVAFVDLTDQKTKSFLKFVQYRRFPETHYSVLVTLTERCLKISVGFNPWCGKSLDVNIGHICAKFGGGGHAVVGAISLKRDEISRALEIAGSIVDTLQSPEEPQLP